jgi:hypothetical protein
MTNTLDRVNAKIFAEQLNSRFQVVTENLAPLELELVDVIEKEAPPKYELFFLVFRGPQSQRLEQRIHRLEHGKLGVLDIFLTAIGIEENGLLYEAVFNRPRRQP